MLCRTKVKRKKNLEVGLYKREELKPPFIEIMKTLLRVTVEIATS